MAPAAPIIELEDDSDEADAQFDQPLDFDQIDRLLDSPNEWHFAPPLGFERAEPPSPRLADYRILAEPFDNLRGMATSPPPARMSRRAIPSTPAQQTGSLPFRGNAATPSRSIATPTPQAYEQCLIGILELFPDISHDHMRELYDAEMGDAQGDGSSSVMIQNLVEKILEKQSYPKEKDRLNELKRKRAQESDEEELAEYQKAEAGGAIGPYLTISKLVMQEDFVMVPVQYIDSKLKESRKFFKAYESLATSERDLENGKTPPYQRLKRPRKQTTLASPGKLDRFIDDTMQQAYGPAELKREIAAARKQRKKGDDRQKVQKEKDIADKAREKAAIEQGHVMTCGICLDEETPDFKIIHCNNPKTSHFSCFDCFRSYAANQIGVQKWELTCCDTSECPATFRRSQLEKALDRKTLDTLDRLQSQAEIKQANMDGISHCPFCPYAAFCPPIEVDWEFRCENPKCEKVSCRRCDRETHAPKSCKEAKEEQGIDERHAIEEARTAAMIKHCPGCQKAIVKTHGCNKVQCACGRVMCDVCGKDITRESYNHFADPKSMRVMGRMQKCPMQDNSEARLDNQVQEAEEKAMKKIREQNPDISEDDLKIKFRKEVQPGMGAGEWDDGMGPRRRGLPGVMPPGMGYQPGNLIPPFPGVLHGHHYGPEPAYGPPPLPYRMPPTQQYPYGGPPGYGAIPHGAPPPMMGNQYDPFMQYPQPGHYPHGRRRY